MTEVRLHVAGYADGDAEERAELAWRLEQELRELDVEDVSHAGAEEAPPGAKGSAVEWAQLVITFAGSLPPLVTALRSWLGRHPGSSITLEIDGDRLTLSDPSSSERSELIAAWMGRHGG
jgi:hypothetical protein